MAGKSAAPLLLGLGAAALLLSGKKKKKSEKKLDGNTTDPTRPDFRPNWNEIHRPETVLLRSGWDQLFDEGKYPNAKMVFSDDCSEFAQEINPDEHNNYITMMFHYLVENMPHADLSVDNITMAILKDQSPNCPWVFEPQWTDLMVDVHSQLRQGVAEYAASFG